MAKKTLTTWSLESTGPLPELDRSLDADVAIVGGGLAGMLTAYLLSKSGKKVIILEKDRIGAGATELTTAFLTQSIDTDFADLIRVFGLEHAKAIIASHGAAINLIERISEENAIDCDFSRCSNHIYAPREKDVEKLEIERDAARELGLKAKLQRDGSGLGFKNRGCMEIERQAKFHPQKFMRGLADACIRNGVKIFERTEVKDIDVTDAGTVSVATEHHAVQARWAVSATYSPFGQPLKLFFKKGMYKTYVLEAYTDLPLREGIYEDTYNPYHYLRIDAEGRGFRIIIGGADHREEIPLNEMRSFNALSAHLNSLIPEGSYVIRKRWTGPILEPIDGLAFIGPLDESDPVLYATAFSGNGMTYSSIAALMIDDHIAGKENPWKEIYAASRLPGLSALFTKGKDYSAELARGAIRNRLTQPKKPRKGMPAD